MTRQALEADAAFSLSSVTNEKGTTVVVFGESEHSACAARAVLVGYASVV